MSESASIGASEDQDLDPVQRASSDGTLLLPCASNAGWLTPAEGYDFLWVRADPAHKTAVHMGSLIGRKGGSEQAQPDLKNQVILSRQSVIDLRVQLRDWLRDTQERTEACSNTSTKDSLQGIASPSESNVSSSELTVEMVFQIARTCAQEAILGSSNSSSLVESCGLNKDCGSGI